MPYIENNGTKLFYEVEGQGYPLFIHHGLSGHPDSWRAEGYVKTLAENNKLILLHARGHGRSDKPHNPEAYSMKNMVSDVTAVLDHLQIPKAHFYGYSMGGRVGLATGKYAPERVSSLIIGGSGLSEKDSKDEKEDLLSIIEYFDGEQESVTRYEEQGWPESVEGWKQEKMLNSDYDAYRAYCNNHENIGLANFLPTYSVPCLLYAGTEDQVHSKAKLCAEVMPCASFVSISGVDHGDGFDKSELVLPHVTKFLEKHNR